MTYRTYRERITRGVGVASICLALTTTAAAVPLGPSPDALCYTHVSVTVPSMTSRCGARAPVEGRGLGAAYGRPAPHLGRQTS